MLSSDFLKAGRLSEAMSALQAEIRARPEDPGLRIFLFQLNCMLGRWHKALEQLQAVASLNPETMLLAQVFRAVIACEILRKEVFDGKRLPLTLGPAEEWIAELAQASAQVARGEFEAAARLRERAFDKAAVSTGRVNESAFQWIADADSRLGPVLEVILEGKYYWVPFSRIQRIEVEKPVDLRDLIWAPAKFVWSNGGMASGHIPARYPESEDDTNDQVRMARITEWLERPGETFLGRGQRVFATDQGDFGLFECGAIQFDGNESEEPL
jgi:type VI secretion system protein ImpE